MPGGELGVITFRVGSDKTNFIPYTHVLDGADKTNWCLNSKCSGNVRIVNNT